jgi:hypothetical protein
MSDLICQDVSQRRADLLALGGASALNGIDYVEVDPADHSKLRAVFLRPVPAAGYGFPAQPDLITITGGVRKPGIHVVKATVAPPDALALECSEAGDFSTYVLTLRHPDLDPPLSEVPISFAATCATDVDCRADDVCPPEPADEPLIDYLARDYASFVRLLQDVAAVRHGSFTDGNAADLAQMLIELLAYRGDHLSYLLDAVATEGYLDIARQRRSLRRHARLVDYRMHEGRNAWTWVTFAVSADGDIPGGTPLLSRIGAALSPGGAAPVATIPDTWLDPAQPERFETSAALREAAVFETAHAVSCVARNGEIQVHTWGNDDCSLPRGAREGYLFSVSPGGLATRPALTDGDFLVLEEVRGSSGGGLPADADRRHRTVVRIEGEPEDTADALYSRTLLSVGDPVSHVAQWELQRWTAGPTLPLLRVRWRRADALPFPLCLSATTPDGRRLRSIAVARGNVALADHGRTVAETLEPLVPKRIPVEVRLKRGPLTQQAPTMDGRHFAARPLASARTTLAGDPGDVIPAVVMRTVDVAGARTWSPVSDLLDSTPFDEHVVAEPGAPVGGGPAAAPAIEGDPGGVAPGGTLGTGAVVRFGDGVYGADPRAGRERGTVAYTAWYRVGNGPAGNVGADTLAHIAVPAVAGGWPTVNALRNPLAATGGIAPEDPEEVRAAAPAAFSVDQLRAITESDYAAAAQRLASVQDAVAGFRWTGSWLTVFVAVDPADEADLVAFPDGRTGLAAAFEAQVRARLATARQTGYDIELRPPRFVALELVLDLCVAAGHFRSEVAAAVRAAMGGGYEPDGTPGFFNAIRRTFAQTIWLSAIYAAVEAVPGVDSVHVMRFRRLGQGDNQELELGRLDLGRWEIARCDNDPNFAEHGTLTVTAHGGKG